MYPVCRNKPHRKRPKIEYCVEDFLVVISLSKFGDLLFIYALNVIKPICWVCCAGVVISFLVVDVRKGFCRLATHGV